MRSLADLHTHSTASDGQYSPAQVVELAHKSGIQVLAITDHDTIHGVEEAVQARQSLELTVLRGVELGAQEDRHMHILGLGLKQDCPELAQLCQKLLDGRNERKYRIVRFLSEKGISPGRGGSAGWRRCDRPSSLRPNHGASRLCERFTGGL